MYKNPFPSHDKYLQEFKEDPTTAKARLLKLFVKKPLSFESLTSKLQLLARLQNEMKTDITAFVDHLAKTEKKEKILKALAEVYLDQPKHLLLFIDYLKEKAVLTHNDKKALYLALYRSHIKDRDEDRERGIVYLEKLLTLTDLKVLQRIEGHAYLGMDYLVINFAEHQEKCISHFSEAVRLEEGEKAKGLTGFNISNYFFQYLNTWINHPEFEILSLQLLHVLFRIYASNFSILFLISNYIAQKLNQTNRDPEIHLMIIELAQEFELLRVPLANYIQTVMNLPDSTLSRFHKAQIALTVHDTDTTIALLSSATDTLSLYLLGIAYWEKHQTKKTSELLALALEQNRLNPQLSPSYLLDTYDTLMKSFTASKSYVKAIRLSDEALQFFPHSSSLIEGRFIAYKCLNGKPKLKLESIKPISDDKELSTPFFTKSENLAQEKKLQHDFSKPVNKIADFDPADEIHALINNREYNKAKEKIVALELQFPEMHLENSLLATLYFSEGNIKIGHQYLEKALDYFDADYLASSLMMSHFYLQEYQQAEAKAYFILQQWNQEFRYGRLARQEALSTLTHIYHNTSTLQKGIEQFLTFSENPDFSSEEKTYVHLSLALFYYFSQQYDYCEKHAKQALSGRFAPTNKEAYLLLGFSYFYQNQSTLAIQTLEKCVDEFPKCATVLMDLGYCYWSLDNHQKSLACFQQTLELHPLMLIPLMQNLPEQFIERLLTSIVQNSSMTPTENIKTEEKETPLQEPLCDHSTVIPSSPHMGRFYSHEQLMHRVFQIDKKRQLENKMQLEEQDDEKDIPGWEVPGTGFIDINNENVTNIRFSQQTTSTKSNLYAFFNKAKLNQPCEDDLITESEKIIKRAVIVGKKGKQGIRILSQEETIHAANRYHLPPGCNSKLKFEADRFGDIRIFGHPMVAKSNKQFTLYVYDTIVTRAHPSRK